MVYLEAPGIRCPCERCDGVLSLFGITGASSPEATGNAVLPEKIGFQCRISYGIVELVPLQDVFHEPFFNGGGMEEV